MNSIVDSFAIWLLEVGVASTLLLACALFGAALIRQPANRMVIFCCTLVGLAIFVSASFLPVRPRIDLASWFYHARESQTSSVQFRGAGQRFVLSERIPLAENILHQQRDRPERIEPYHDEARSPLPARLSDGPGTLVRTHWKVGGAAIWLGGAALSVLWIAIGAIRTQRFLRSAVAAQKWVHDELARVIRSRRKPRLYLSSRVDAAVVLGVWRPVIVLGQSLVGHGNLAGLRAVLAHEWAHIRRGDLWLLLLQRLLLPIFFAHPLYWWLRRRIHEDQEFLADAVAARNNPVKYAEALLALAETPGNSPTVGTLPALAVWRNRSTLTRRIEMLLETEKPVAVGSSRSWRWLTLALVLGAVASLSVLSLHPAAARQPKSKPAPQDRPNTEILIDELTRKSGNQDAFDSILKANPAVGVLEVGATLARIHNEQLEAADLPLSELIQETADGQCRLEGDVIIANVATPRAERLLAQIREVDGGIIFAQPRIITTGDRIAEIVLDTSHSVDKNSAEDSLERAIRSSVQENAEVQGFSKRIIALQARLAEIEARSARGKDDPLYLADLAQLKKLEDGLESLRVDLAAATRLRLGGKVSRELPAKPRESNLRLEIRPRMGQGESAGTVTLEVVLATGADEEKAEQPAVRKRLKLQAVGDVKFGQALLLAERPPRRNVKGSRETLLIILTPKPVSLELSAPAREPALDRGTSPDLESALQRENEELKSRVDALQRQVDELQALAKAGETPRVDDAEFLRRAYLDVTGILPTAEETRRFMNDSRADKRQQLIGQLLSSPEADAAVAERLQSLRRESKIDVAVRREVARKLNPDLGSRDKEKASMRFEVIALKYVLANNVADAIRETFKGRSESQVKVISEARTNSILVHADGDELEEIKAIVSQLEQIGEKVIPGRDVSPKGSRRLHEARRKLAEIDLLEAEANLKASVEEAKIMQELVQSGQAQVQQARTAEFNAEKARLEVERAKIRLDLSDEEGKEPEASVPPERPADRPAKRETQRRLLELELKQAEAEYEVAVANRKRTEALAGTAAISQTEVDQSASALTLARLKVERVKIQLEDLEGER